MAILSNHPPGVALITGAADRIGAAMARRLCAEGWAVVIHYRSSGEKAGALIAELTSAGARAAAVQADLADRPSRSALVEKAVRHWGPLTLLVNNASTFEPDAATDLAETLWDSHFSVHVEAPAFLARDFAAQLPADRTGNIVNIIDSRVLRLTPNYFSYTLSKATLWTMTQTLAQSLAPRIRVNAIGPGPTMREAGQSEESFARSQSAAPLGHAAGPDDVCDALMFLVSSSNVTGQMISVDGGKHIEFPAGRGPTPRPPHSGGQS